MQTSQGSCHLACVLKAHGWGWMGESKVRRPTVSNGATQSIVKAQVTVQK